METIIIQLLIGTVYTAIIFSLIWARFRFFKITSTKSKLVSYLNDPAVLVQLVFTYWLLWQTEQISPLSAILAVAVYLLALALFWWAIKTAGTLDFASSSVKEEIFTSGAFGLVRHPFYLSYIMVWITSSALLGSIYLWVSCAVLIGLYYMSAKQEEASMVGSELGESYKAYALKTGMFVPKVLG
jgi:protein-S-isoprenylcysteine O-methyltransferase Ste14